MNFSQHALLGINLWVLLSCRKILVSSKTRASKTVAMLQIDKLSLEKEVTAGKLWQVWSLIHPRSQLSKFSPLPAGTVTWLCSSSIQFWVGANAMKTFLCEVPPLMGLVYLKFLAQFLGVTIQLISWVVSDWGWIPRS